MATQSNKAKRAEASVLAHINAIEDVSVQKDAKTLLRHFKEVTGAEPALWGSMVGFGRYHYKYESGREGDYFATGFALRKSGLTIYIMPGYGDYSHILKTLGPHKLGKSCLYLKSLHNVHIPTLKKLLRAGLADLKKKYPVTMNP